jgi:hypothetical protein
MSIKILEQYTAIDPMALILSSDAYQKWVEIHYPHVPKTSELDQIVKELTAEERMKAVSNARKLTAYCKAFMDAAAKIK